MTHKKCLSIVTAARCTLDESDSGLTLDAPLGSKLTASGAHCFCQEYGGHWPDSPTKSKAYAIVADAIRDGLIPCDEGAGCEICHPDGSDGDA